MEIPSNQLEPLILTIRGISEMDTKIFRPPFSFLSHSFLQRSSLFKESVIQSLDCSLLSCHIFVSRILEKTIEEVVSYGAEYTAIVDIV